MFIVNKSKNTIYVDDLDYYLPYKDDQPEEIPSDVLKKSRSLRAMILSDMIDIQSFDPEDRMESSLAFLKQKTSPDLPKKTTNEVMSVSTTPDLIQCSDDIEVKIHGIFYDPGGYGKVNRNLAINLQKAGCKVQIDSKRSHNQLNEDELRPFAGMSKTKLSKNHILIDSVIPSFADLSSGRYKILYTTIESYSVPKQFLECCEQYDEIWITSDWSASILRPLTKKPIYVIPTGTDNTLYTEHGPKFSFGTDANNFVFLSVFGWNYRKGYDLLLKAYLDEFSSSDPVSLLIVSRYQSGHSNHHKNKIRDDIDGIMKQFSNKNLPHIVRYSKITPEQDMPKLYRAANVFVLFPRGEGSNLCAPEASLCGLPVIMTNCSGQQLYLRPDNAYLVEMDYLEEVRTGQMGIHYWDGQKFPALTSQSCIDQAKSAMRSVYENYQDAKNRNKRLQKLILDNFTWKHTANKAIERLKTIKANMV